MGNRLVAAIAVAVLAAGCASAGPPAAGEERAAAAFERMKGLAGSWSGEMQFGDEKIPAMVDYRVTSGGSAVEETIFRGTPHEMVTMYHRDGSRLMLTHYCAAQNQPSMVLLPGDDPAKLEFGFLHATNLASPGAGHMHEACFEFPAEGRLDARWTYWEDGKPGHAAQMKLTRK